MKTCSICHLEKEEESFYKSRKICKPCMVKYNARYKAVFKTFPAPKSYEDYLKESGQYEYYQRTLKYQV